MADEHAAIRAHAALVRQLRAALGLGDDVDAATLLTAAVEAAVERDRLTVALDGIECLEFRRGWLAEAEAIWHSRCDENAAPHEVILWATRSRELVTVMIAAHSPLDGRDEAVAAARRRLGKGVAQ